MDEKGKAVLDKIRLNTRDDYVKVNITIYQNAFKWTFLQGATSGSIRASDRLMRELSDIYKSESYKKG